MAKSEGVNWDLGNEGKEGGAPSGRIVVVEGHRGHSGQVSFDVSADGKAIRKLGLQPEVLNEASLHELTKALRRTPGIWVIHFSGHGSANPDSIQLSNPQTATAQQPGSHHVAAIVLMDSLEKVGRLIPLLFLNACHSDGVARLAVEMGRAECALGIAGEWPASLAMILAEHFYEALREERPRSPDDFRKILRLAIAHCALSPAQQALIRFFTRAGAPILSAPVSGSPSPGESNPAKSAPSSALAPPVSGIQAEFQPQPSTELSHSQPSTGLNHAPKPPTEPDPGDKEITAYVINVDLVDSGKHLAELRRWLPPGEGDASVILRQWLDRVWTGAADKHGLERNCRVSRQDQGDGICLIASSARSAHGFAGAVHEACLEKAQGQAESVDRKFRVGIAKGTATLFTDREGRPAFSSMASTTAERLQAVAKPGGTMVCPETWKDLPSQYQSHYDELPLELPHPKPKPGFETVTGHGWPRRYAGRENVITGLEAMLSQKPASPFQAIFENTGLGSWNGSTFRVASGVADGSAEFVRILERIRENLEPGSKVQKGDRDDFLKAVGWIATLGLDRSWIELQLEAQFNGLPMALPATGGKGVEPHPNHPGVVIDVPTFVSSALAGAPVPVAKVAKAGNAPYVRTTAPQVARGPKEGDKRFEALLTVLKTVLPHVDVTPKTGEQTEEYLGRIEGEIEAARRHAEKLHRDGQPVLVTGNHLHDFIRVIQAKFSDRLYITRYLDRNFHCVLKDHFGVVTELIRILEILDTRNTRPSKSKP